MASADFHLVVVDDVPTPYRLALLKEVQALGRFRMTVIFLAAAAREKQWQLDVERSGLVVRYVKDAQHYIKALDTRVQLTWGVAAILRKLAPDIVVTGGYHHAAYWRCLAYCRWRGVPLIAWSGTTPMSEWRRWFVLRLLKRAYIAASRHTFAYGSAAARFVEGIGGHPGRITKIYNTTDLRAFRRGWIDTAARHGPHAGPLRFVFVGRLTPYKGLHYVLQVMASLKSRFDFHFDIIGDGHFRAPLEALVGASGLSDRVAFIGYVQQADLAEHLAAADIFVFPPVQEVWGIVVNEALATGLFVLSSTLAGVTEDLVDPAISGLPIEPRDPASIERALTAVLSDPDAIRARRDERSRWVMRYSADVIAHDFADAVAMVWRDRASRTVVSQRQ